MWTTLLASVLQQALPSLITVITNHFVQHGVAPTPAQVIALTPAFQPANLEAAILAQGQAWVAANNPTGAPV